MSIGKDVQKEEAGLIGKECMQETVNVVKN